MIKNYPLWKVNPLNQFSAYIEEKEKYKKEKKGPKENSGLSNKMPLDESLEVSGGLLIRAHVYPLPRFLICHDSYPWTQLSYSVYQKIHYI